MSKKDFERDKTKVEMNVMITTKYDKLAGTEEHSISLVEYVKFQQEFDAAKLEIEQWKYKYIEARRSGYEEGLEESRALLSRMAEVLRSTLGKDRHCPCGECQSCRAWDILSEYHKSAFAEGVSK